MAIINPDIKIAKAAKDKLNQVDVNDEIKNFLKGLPSMIIQNGLIQSLAFIGGKTDDEYKKLYAIIEEFFKEHFADPEGRDLPEMNILTYLVDYMNDLNSYTYYQQGILTFTIWLKRFALALH